MKYFNRKIALSNAILSVILLSGCASTSTPTSNVGIVNGKYAVQTTIPNNNKGKKVNLTGGQGYSCETSFIDNNGKTNRVTFDLQISKDAKNMTWYNDKVNGVTPDTAYIGKLVFKPGLGFVETTKQDQVLVGKQDNTGMIGVFATVKDAQNFFKINKRFQNGEITKAEWQNLLKKKKVRAYEAVCTQTTNNTYTHTRYLTDHEIDAYKHGQQIAVQQRAINSANTNATLARIQAQNAQMNYNTQQMLNRMNTYNVNIVGY